MQPIVVLVTCGLCDFDGLIFAFQQRLHELRGQRYLYFVAEDDAGVSSGSIRAFGGGQRKEEPIGSNDLPRIWKKLG